VNPHWAGLIINLAVFALIMGLAHAYLAGAVSP